MTDGVLIGTQEFTLPASIITKADLSRLVEEVEKLNNQMIEDDARQKVGSPDGGQSVLSPSLLDFFSINDMHLNDNIDLGLFIKQLRAMVSKAPVVHLTFATEADEASLAQVVSWLRKSIHSQVVVSVGLQPSILGGVYLRTTNHVLDLSLRKQLEGSRELLIKQVGAITGGE